MSIADDIRSEVGGILKENWTTRDGLKVPETADIELGNNAVKLDATVLYADLAESTNLVNSFLAPFAAEVYKSYLRAACQVIQKNSGVVTAFDGDRVMAVFIGGQKNTQAVGSALEINHAVCEIISPMIKESYPKSTYGMRQGVGVDTSPLFIASTGVRGSNDLVWVGRAANYAAKLSSFREGVSSAWMTADVFAAMHDSVKFSDGQPTGKPMWENRMWEAHKITVYRSGWMRRP